MKVLKNNLFDEIHEDTYIDKYTHYIEKRHAEPPYKTKDIATVAQRIVLTLDKVTLLPNKWYCSTQA